MKIKISLAVALIAVAVMRDLSARSRASDIIDDVVLRVSEHADDNSIAMLKRASSRLGSFSARPIVIGRRPVRQAASLISDQISAAEYCVRRCTETGTGPGPDVEPVLVVFRNNYDDSLRKFRHDLEYIRRAL